MPIRSAYTPYDIERARKAIKYIRYHYAENISADQLAIEAVIDKRLLQKLMQFFTGMTVHHYLIKVRLEEATEDLSENFRLSISEIAYRHGFASSSHFIRIFRQHNDLTPNEYRYQLITKCKAV